MKSMKARILALLLAMLMTVSVFAMTGCPNSADPGDDTPTPGTPSTPGADEGGEEDEEERLSIDYLPQQTWSDTINFLEWTVDDMVDPGPGWNPWEEIDVDQRDGDLIGDAIYDRNSAVEEKFGVTITKEYLSINGSPQYVTAFRANEESGDQAYQAITNRTTTITGLVQEGLLYDMNKLENLHTDMPWWNADSVRSYAFGDALYCAAPEMLLRDKGATALMFYNHTVASEYEIDNLYGLAKDGEWTWEYMLEFAETVTGDLDGDDAISSAEDMYGISGGGRDIPYYLFTGTGMKFAQMDEDGYLELLFGTDEQYVLVWQEILDEVMYSDYYVGNSADQSLFPEDFNVFKSDKSLFEFGLVKTVMSFRDMTSAYGVLPIPKYDDLQKDYASLVWMHHDSVLAIPGSVQNLESVSTVIEYMSYLSYYEVYPKFYDTVILGRSARDEESKELLELVFATRTFDPGQYWLTAEMHGSNSFLTLFETKTRNIASLWGGMESKANTAVDKFNERLDEIG